MSNILIIKHGSLGDIAQASGVIQDISENHKDDDIFILTTKPYLDLFRKNPYIKEPILDKRLSRFNPFYLYSLMRDLKKYNFLKIYDLQNSNRTSFYKNILFKNSKKDIWSSSLTTLPEGKTKQEFDKLSVLDRFDHQIKTCNLVSKHTLYPDFSWACSDIANLKNEYNLNKYILLFPFCSPHLTIKRWPYYNELSNKIKNEFKDEYKIIVAPGPEEIKEASNINAECILDRIIFFIGSSCNS
jgi:ADP-heptose:LPS heptosyltransferase